MGVSVGKEQPFSMTEADEETSIKKGEVEEGGRRGLGVGWGADSYYVRSY